MRGHRPLEAYCGALQGGASEKIRAVLPWIRAVPGSEILDIGSGTGLIAAEQARRLRRASVVAIDSLPEMLAAAQRLHGGWPNLQFREGAADQIHSAGATCVVLSSVLHEVYSYNGRSGEAVGRVLRAAWQSLHPGGRLIIRDFVRPACHEKLVFLKHRSSDIVYGHDFASFSRNNPHHITLFESISKENYIYYRTDLGSAFEFILRKDYHYMWDFEHEERYGYWTYK
jgi:SAM-dependent methyltransferase